MSGVVAFDDRKTIPLTSTHKRVKTRTWRSRPFLCLSDREEDIETGTEEKKDGVDDLGNDKTTVKDGATGNKNIAEQRQT